jgi:hypothetical protein
VEKQLPFELKVPNAETRAAMEEARTMSRARFANSDKLINELEKGSRRSPRFAALRSARGLTLPARAR